MTALALALLLSQASPNMGMTIPTPGVTPGPTYATNISNDLSIIDAHNHTAGNGVQVPTAGININAVLPFNGFGASGFNSCTGTACGISNPFLGTLVADAGNFNQAIVDAGSFNLIQANGVVSDAGTFDWLIVDGGQIIQSAPSTTLTLEGNAAATAATAIILDNQTTQTSGTIVSFATGGTAKGSISQGGKFLSNPGIFSTGIATTSTSLVGNQAATGAVATILDNNTTQTTGTITSFRSGGVEQAKVDFTGNIFLNGVVQESGATSQLSLIGNAASGGTAVSLQNSGDVGATGMAMLIKQNGANQFAISGRGHVVPLSTTPTVGTFAAGFNTPTGISVTGSDASLKINFTTGAAPSAIAIGTALMVVTFANAFAATTFNGFAAFGSIPGSGDEAPLVGVATATNTLTIYNIAAFTPQGAHAYSISVWTSCAGCSS